MSEVKPMTVQEWIDAGNTVEKLGVTTEFKYIDPRTLNNSRFGNLPPKVHFAPPAPRRSRRHKIRSSSE